MISLDFSGSINVIVKYNPLFPHYHIDLFRSLFKFLRLTYTFISIHSLAWVFIWLAHSYLYILYLSRFRIDPCNDSTRYPHIFMCSLESHTNHTQSYISYWGRHLKSLLTPSSHNRQHSLYSEYCSDDHFFFSQF